MGGANLSHGVPLLSLPRADSVLAPLPVHRAPLVSSAAPPSPSAGERRLHVCRTLFSAAVSLGLCTIRRQRKIGRWRCGRRSLRTQEGGQASGQRSSSTFTSEAACFFEQRGFVKLPGVSPEQAQSMLDLLWVHYAQKHGVRRDDPKGTLTRRGCGIRLYGPVPHELAASEGFQDLLTKIHKEVDAAFGHGLKSYRTTNRTVFVNFPNYAGDSWTVPGNWHTDVPFDPSDPQPSVIYAFAFLDHCEPCGGGTMLLAGSSMRAQMPDMESTWGTKANVDETRSKALMETLSREDLWFASLFGPRPLYNSHDFRYLCNKATAAERIQRFMKEGIVSAGIPMRVIELTGAPGDIVLWDPRCLHSQSNNVSSRPRSAIRFRLDRAVLRGG